MFVLFVFPQRYTMKLPQNDYTAAAALISHWLCYFNSAINPVIYNFMSGKTLRPNLFFFYQPNSSNTSHIITLLALFHCCAP